MHLLLQQNLLQSKAMLLHKCRQQDSRDLKSLKVSVQAGFDQTSVGMTETQQQTVAGMSPFFAARRTRSCTLVRTSGFKFGLGSVWWHVQWSLLTVQRFLLTLRGGNSLLSIPASPVKYRIQPQILLFCLLVPCAPLQAHPVSFVDAWAKVGHAVDVRLNIFLEDVLRYQMPDADLETAMPIAKAQQAVEDYSRTLLKQLKLLDESGKALQGELTGQPTWQPRDDSIVPSEESLLKLTWHLRFTPTDETQPKAICFLHEFTGQSQQSPGELRVHLLHMESGRRIDAVVPPWIPHTILLPTETGSPTTMGQHTPHSRLVVGALDIVHEFVAPVAMLDTVFPEAPELRRRQLKTSDTIHLTAKQMQAIESATKTWVHRHIQLQINGNPAAIHGVSVMWFTSDVENQGEQPAIAPTELPFIGTRLAVRASYRSSGRADVLGLSIDKSPGAVTEVTSEIVSPTETDV